MWRTGWTKYLAEKFEMRRLVEKKWRKGRRNGRREENQMKKIGKEAEAWKDLQTKDGGVPGVERQETSIANKALYQEEREEKHRLVVYQIVLTPFLLHRNAGF